MGEKTNIAWTDHTWNPWRGCVKVSPGCANCYADIDRLAACEFCGDQGPLLLKAKCHLTAPLLAELDGDTLVLKCYIPSCMKEVARFKIVREQT